MDGNVTVDTFEGAYEASMAFLKGHLAQVDEEMRQGIRDAGDASLAYLHGNSPRDTGDYAASWDETVEDEGYGHIEVTVGNRIGQLTHLLTDGHDIYTSRGGPFGHVGPADPQGYVDEAFEQGRKALEAATGIEVGA